MTPHTRRTATARNRACLWAAALALLAGLDPSWAGRPLASDDAGAAEHGTCQVEGWVERARSDRASVVAPACGIAHGVELGFDYTLPSPRDTLRASAGVALKWVPEAAKVGTALGELNFGLKLGAAYDRLAGQGWQRAETGVLALATLQASDALAMHANLGLARETGGPTTATVLNLALVWTPNEHALLFVESQANDKRAVFGGTVSTVGARWWLVKDRLGLDLTAGREAGAGSGTVWSLGFGWYGIGF